MNRLFSANAADMIHFAEATLHVYPDGSVLSVPPVTFESLCRLGNIRLKAIIQMIGNNSYFSMSDLRMWPWDTQTCTLIIGSWGHDG